MNEYVELTSAFVIFVDKFIRDFDKLLYYLNKSVFVTKNWIENVDFFRHFIYHKMDNVSLKR